MNYETFNWKAAAQQSVNNGDAEKAFFDLAYNSLKVTPLLKAPYRVGFEIVEKNDDATRMTGIVVFRIGKELFYNPLVFVGGKIKGADLFYRVSTKMFIPANDDWSSYLLNINQLPEGEGVPFSVRQQANNYGDLTGINRPPTYYKFAATLTNEVKTNIEEIVKRSSHLTPETESILRKFITEDGGFSAIEKIAKWADDYDFANQLFLNSVPENYAPELEMEKAATAQPLIVLHRNLLDNGNVKSASTNDIKKGYRIDDFRKQADLNQAVFASAEDGLDSVTEPGVYNVLLADGSRKKCFCAYPDEGESSPYTTSPRRSLRRSGLVAPLVLVDLDSKQSRTTDCRSNAFGEFVGSIEQSDLPQYDMSAGKSYRIYDTRRHMLSALIYVRDTATTPAGLKSYITGTSKEDGYGDITYVHNPDYAGRLDDSCIIGKDYKFVEVAFKKTDYGSIRADNDDFKLGDASTVDQWIFQAGDGEIKKACVTKRDEGYLIQKWSGDKQHGDFEKLAAKLALMHECDMPETVADDVLEAADNGTYSFFYKSAQQLAWRNFPEFYTQFNNEFGVPQEDADAMQTATIAQGNYPIQLKHRIGDGLRHAQRNEDSAPSESPAELYQMSQAKGTGNIFEHGVVGTLAKTYDSIELIDKYLPDLEKALDRLGRIIFLLYWKPDDFVKAYGADDQSDMETKLLSNFKSLGDVVLDLIMKTKATQRGSAPLR